MIVRVTNVPNAGQVQTIPASLVPIGPGRFNVVVSTTFPTLGTFPYTVTATRIDSGETHEASSTVAVVPAGQGRISGRLSPLSDTGVSQDDAITGTPFPTFIGTARPFAVVLLYGRRFDQKQDTLLGRVVADAQGSWQITAGPLSDGNYTITATISPANGQPEQTFLYSPVSPLVIDTLGISVVGVTADPSTRTARVTFAQEPGGFVIPTLVDPANYGIRRGLSPRIPPIRPIAANLEFANTQEVVVALRFPRRIPRSFLLDVSGVSDLAGNPLAGLFRTNARPSPTRVLPYG